MIEINAIIYRPLLVNTYIVHEEETKKGFIIDPAGKFESVMDVIGRHKIRPVFILYTHLHLDHIAGGHDLATKLSIPAYACEKDLYLFDAIEQTAMFLGYPPIIPPVIDSYIKDGDELEIGSSSIRILSTPGHTPGGLSFSIADSIFTGDTIFRESTGRTDLPGGDQETLYRSIKEKIYAFPDDFTIRPGHGEYTTVGHEKVNNPFVKAT